MLLSFVSAALGLATLTAARPTEATYVTTSQLEEVWKQQVDNYVRNMDSAEVAEVSANISTMSSSLAGCEDVFMVFTRGTFEPAGDKNLGMMVGGPFASALTTALGSGRFGAIGVDYNNGVMGYLTGGDSGGAATMGKLITDKVKECPRTKIVASGYRLVPRNKSMHMLIQHSQGAQVTHNAVHRLDNNVMSHIAAVVSFQVALLVKILTLLIGHVWRSDERSADWRHAC